MCCKGNFIWKAFLFFVLFFVFNFLSGCVNQAAERLTDDCWRFRSKLVLNNTNFTQRERELFVVEIMQAKGFDDERISDEVEKIRKERKQK